jgi:hypothetical protein
VLAAHLCMAYRYAVHLAYRRRASSLGASHVSPLARLDILRRSRYLVEKIDGNENNQLNMFHRHGEMHAHGCMHVARWCSACLAQLANHHG